MIKNNTLLRSFSLGRFFPLLNPSSLLKSSSLLKCAFGIRAFLCVSLISLLGIHSGIANDTLKNSSLSENPSQSKNPSRAETLKNVEEALGKYTSLSSGFTQLSQGGNMVEGKFYLERPGKLRFEYGPDVPFLVVSNGTLISFVDYELKEVARWPISKTPLGLLVDKDITLDDKRIEIPELRRMAGLLKVTIIDPDRLEFGQITLVFEESNMELRGWEILDAQGFTTIVSLFNVTYNQKIDKSKFKFDDPRPRRNRKH